MAASDEAHEEGVASVGIVLAIVAIFLVAESRRLLTLDVRFRGDLSGNEIGAAIARLDGSLRCEIPHLSRIFIEPERTLEC